jgi:hypothetical protein
MAHDPKDMQKGILGDINPKPGAHDEVRGRNVDDTANDPQSMEGGSKEGESRHSGSRDVTDATTGGLTPEVGGTRNFRTGSGATGTDIGQRPE